MSGRLLTLQEICVITLLRHHILIEDISYIPYRLIKSVLAKLKVDQLMKLEQTNPLIIFEDDEIWYDLIRRDVDPTFSYQYTNKKNEILQYFKRVITNYTGTSTYKNIDTETLKNFVRPIVTKNDRGLYRVPCRLVYEKMREEILEKDKRIAAKVRETTKRIQQEKNKIQITAMVEPVSGVSSRLRNKFLESKSKVFVDSLRESQKRRQHFKKNIVNIEKRVVERLAFGGQAGVSPSSTRCNDITDTVRPQPVSIPQKDNQSASAEADKKTTMSAHHSLPQKRPIEDHPKRKKSRLFGTSSVSSSGSCNIYIHQR
ncbi:Ela1 [Kluyveromyces lactis]|nr:Ela1 [Kluyveromyces lactis]